jgi:hypothetical protein
LLLVICCLLFVHLAAIIKFELSAINYLFVHRGL